jgi:precorrin-2 dehydrogenase/sirohydrochlorin ferrochelatase
MAMVGGYPIFLDLRGRAAVIIGGGGVAVRKAEGLLAGGIARVRCVAPRIDPRMPESVERVMAGFEPNHLDGFDLVFAATDLPAVNARVVREAHLRKMLCNRTDTDDSDPGDFTLPAVHREGGLVLAVSATGAPAVAAAVRDDLSRKLSAGHVMMADAMAAIRPWVQSAPGLDTQRRQAIFRAMLSDSAVAALREDGIDGLRRWMRQQFADLPA